VAKAPCSDVRAKTSSSLTGAHPLGNSLIVQFPVPPVASLFSFLTLSASMQVLGNKKAAKPEAQKYVEDFCVVLNQKSSPRETGKRLKIAVLIVERCFLTRRADLTGQKYGDKLFSF
jgi:hypothetical protein